MKTNKKKFQIKESKTNSQISNATTHHSIAVVVQLHLYILT